MELPWNAETGKGCVVSSVIFSTSVAIRYMVNSTPALPISVYARSGVRFCATPRIEQFGYSMSPAGNVAGELEQDGMRPKYSDGVNA